MPTSEAPAPQTCPCGSDLTLDACCGRYLRGEQQPATAEMLMRARYSAYVLADVDYIVNTHDPKTVHEVDRAQTEAWAKSSKWLGLEIVSKERGGTDDSDGVVEFVARYLLGGGVQTHRERALFRKHEGRWVFVDGQLVKAEPVRRSGPDVGRNDPCHCGSGKKFKRCHGA